MTERKTRHESTTARLSRDSLHLAKEVRSIQRRAAEHDGRIVSIGALVFFSTDTGDAWILEPADQLAARLAAGRRSAAGAHRRNRNQLRHRLARTLPNRGPDVPLRRHRFAPSRRHPRLPGT